MSYYDGDSDNCCIKIKKLTNGYTVTIDDPAIVKWNKQRDIDNAKPNSVYKSRKDPTKTFVFTDKAKVIKFLGDNLDKAVPSDGDGADFDTSFKLAVVKDN